MHRFSPLAPPPPLTDAERNVQWVFEQMLAMELDDEGMPRLGRGGSQSKRRRSLSLLELGVGGGGGPALTPQIVRHMMRMMGVEFSAEEAQEILDRMDENEDGKVTIEDFWATMKVTPSSRFDARFAVHLPFGALDANKDGLLDSDDFRAAREKFGTMFSCDNDAEFNLIVRALQNPQGSAGEGSGSGAAAAGGGGRNTPLASPARGGKASIDKELFKRIVGTIALQEPSPAGPHGKQPGTGRDSPKHGNMVISLIPASPRAQAARESSAQPPPISLDLSASVPISSTASSSASSSASFTPNPPFDSRPSLPPLSLQSPTTPADDPAAHAQAQTSSGARSKPRPGAPHSARAPASKGTSRKAQPPPGSQTTTHRSRRLKSQSKK